MKIRKNERKTHSPLRFEFVAEFVAKFTRWKLADDLLEWKFTDFLLLRGDFADFVIAKPFAGILFQGFASSFFFVKCVVFWIEGYRGFSLVTFTCVSPRGRAAARAPGTARATPFELAKRSFQSDSCQPDLLTMRRSPRSFYKLRSHRVTWCI